MRLSNPHDRGWKKLKNAMSWMARALSISCEYGLQDLVCGGHEPITAQGMLVAPPNFDPLQRLGDGSQASRPKPTEPLF